MIDAPSTTISAKQLLQALENKGLLATENLEPVEKLILAQAQQQDSPLYLRILAGIGAFLSAVFLLGFLAVSGAINFDSASALTAWGIFLIGIALFINYATEKSDDFGYAFVIQLSFCAMATGKGFIIGASILFSHNPWAFPFTMLLLTAITYYLYPLSLDRFASALVTLVAFMMTALWEHRMGVHPEMIANLIFIIQIILFAVLVTNSRVKRDDVPLTYALAFSLAITVISLITRFDLPFYQVAFSLNIINATLAISLVALITWAAGSLEKLQTEPLVVASIAIFILGLISAPGLLLAIGFLILGYAKQERLLVTMGSLLLPGFLFFYYYHLEITLFNKSVILIMSGLVLLSGYFYLKYRVLNQ